MLALQGFVLFFTLNLNKFWIVFIFIIIFLQPVVTTKSGVVNNVVLIRKTDFEVFDALKSDSEICADISGALFYLFEKYL